ncbi:MAG: YifB family Mg chelatase-like AAA ATPase, partial [Clostridiales bacterium]|nr:YifB family Mg chelatase-like AAA ATPase [Clostridiales bacterium]
AVGTLAASGAIKIARDNADIAFLGELTLDGRLAGIDGALPMIIGLRKHGIRRVVIPPANLAEASLVKDIEIYCARNLEELAEYLSGQMPRPSKPPELREPRRPAKTPDFSDIRGQGAVKRAAQIATAGAHGMLMVGPPGVGKSMVGKRIPGIMPPLSYEEQLEVTQIYSVAGQLSELSPLLTQRPYRAPHHSMSAAALAGGGSSPKPGEISLAHCGVLFLDELPEFSAQALQTLRQPMEDGKVSISRVSGRYTYPARFMLVAAMNPCRCGYYGDPVKACKCTESDRLRYIGRVSGPLLDRIDLHVAMERTVYEDIAGERPRDESLVSSEMLREGVIRAREMQKRRYRGPGIDTNAQLGPSQIDDFCRLDEECGKIMEAAFSRYSMSARSYHRTLKVARTVADLGGSEEIKREHLLEALSYRLPEKFLGVGK